MPNTYMNFEADRAAVANINFCAVWPTARTVLQDVAAVIKNTLVIIAINTVIAACDAYCKAHPANNPPTA